MRAFADRLLAAAHGRGVGPSRRQHAKSALAVAASADGGSVLRMELVIDVLAARLSQEKARARGDEGKDRTDLERAGVGRHGIHARSLNHRARPARIEY